MLLGGTRTPGVSMVADAVGLADHLAKADLVVTGEGRLRLLLPLGQGALRRGRGGQPSRWCRASRWPGRC